MNQEPISYRGLDPESLRRDVPTGPGVYLFKDAAGRILYVGKAKNLRKRVLSYCKPVADLPPKTRLMVQKARSLDTLLTDTENEAFILEDTLIKRHMPRYNVVLRDDKRYPCLRLDLRRPYPRLQVVRRIQKDGALYFGPFSSAGSVRTTLKLIETIFPLRKCRGNQPPRRSRPCLNFQLNRCLGPCTQDVPPETYRDLVEQVRLFLEGRNRELLVRLGKDMKAASEGLQFEKAARIRDQIRAVERTIERQHVVSRSMEDRDAIGVAFKDGVFQVVNLHVRNGALAGSRGYLFRERAASPSEVLEAFIKQYYARETFIPASILISHPVDDRASIEAWISELAGRKVTLHRPVRGEKRRLVSMAETNAENLLRAQAAAREDVMEQLRNVLRLEERPSTVEGMDISNFQGSKAVGTVVRFREGRPDRSGYRNYRIHQVEGIDDYAMMAEMTARRLPKGHWPDVLLVDGGRGHLAVVKRVVDEVAGQEGPALAALAKRDDHLGEQADKVFVPGRKNPLSLAPDHPVLLFLMQVRDETHRRAVAYHRRLRGKAMKASALDGVPGVGPKRKKLLLTRFGSVKALAGAAPEKIAEVPGITLGTARAILEAVGNGSPSGIG
jgi:excinuclease ABC subunit C